MDSQDQPVEIEHRRMIIEAVKRFSSLAKSSTSRRETNKPFFSVLTKPSKTVMRPWPSAINTSHSVQQSIPIPNVFEADKSCGKDVSYHRSSIDNSEERSSFSSRGERDQEGMVNSAFLEERMNDVSDICDNLKDDSSFKPASSSQYYGQESSQQPSTSTTIETVVIDESIRPRINSCPKYLIRRDRSTSSSRKRKGNKWRPRIPLRFRRKTTDAIPTIETILSQTRSSPNLRNIEVQTNTVPSIRMDLYCKQDDSDL